MKDVVALDTNAAETRGFSEVTNFSIQADAKMFRILIGNLYSDKPRAIVRELCSNARDSHAAAGILDRPFLLQIPNRWEDTFKVRDYGTSLTHEQVMGLYTTVGASTKGSSNDEVGKWGLGSKTPFAYTDSFTIAAILNGEKRIYTAFMDQGQPKCALVARVPSDEEQGFEVSFAVQEQDRVAFKVAAQRVMLGFDVLPENNAALAKADLQVTFEGADWRLVKRDYRFGLVGPMVRQGCVLYPIDAAALQTVRRCEMLETFTDECLIVDMPIGSVDITPSRESLSYDPTTSVNLLDKCDSVFKEIMDRFTTAVNDRQSRFDAIVARNQVLNSISDYNLKENLGKHLKWRGKSLASTLTISPTMQSILRRHGVKLSEIMPVSGKRRSSATRSTLSNAHSPLDIHPPRVPTFVYMPPGEQTPKHLAYRLNAARLLYARQHAGTAIFLDGFTPGGKQEAFLRVALGRPSADIAFVKLTDIQFTKPDAGASRNAVSLKALNPRGTDWRDVSEDEIVDDVYFVRTFKGDVEDGDVWSTLHAVNNLFKRLQEFGFVEPDAVLINIPASRKDYASVPEDWTDFFCHARRKLALNFDYDRIAQGETLTNFFADRENQSWAAAIDAMQKAIPGDAESIQARCASALEEHREAQKQATDQQQMLPLIRQLFTHVEMPYFVPETVEEESETRTGPLDLLKSEFKAAYPLLAFVGWGSLTWDQEARKHAAEYMLLRDIVTLGKQA